MALKAGRVGVAPDQVDEFGHISSEATSGYTKQEADAKFETQTHAASTYETKSDAVSALAEKQPILLSVPIEMLSGTKLTVESALQGLNEVISEDVTTAFKTLVMAVSDSHVVNVEHAIISRYGKVVHFNARLNKNSNTNMSFNVDLSTIFNMTPKEKSVFTLNSNIGAGTGIFNVDKTASFRYYSDDTATYVDMNLAFICV